MNAIEKRIEEQMNKRPSHERGRAPGPGSIMWDTFSDMTLMPFTVPILVMQTAHPDVGAAVAKYSVYKKDPWGRMFRTASSLMRFLYGGKGGQQSSQEALDLRKLHSQIKGTRPDGARYHAIHPQTFRVVPDTFLDGVIRIREALGKPLSALEKSKLYQEYVDLCLLFGLRREDIEMDFDAFQVYYDDLLLNKMTYNETVQFLLEEMIKHGPEMKFLPLPKSWWQTLYSFFVYPIIRTCTLGFLDSRFREQHNIRWSRRDQKRYDTLLQFVKLYAALIPRPLRYNLFSLLIMAGGHGAKLMSFERLKNTIAQQRPGFS